MTKSDICILLFFEYDGNGKLKSFPLVLLQMGVVSDGGLCSTVRVSTKASLSSCSFQHRAEACGTTGGEEDEE